MSSISRICYSDQEARQPILVLTDGTVPRTTIDVDYALSTLFPKTLVNNTTFAFTNISSPLSWNFCQETIPEVLKDVLQFQTDNPIALQNKSLKLKDDPKGHNMRTEMGKEVKTGEQVAFGMLDDLEPQATTEIDPPYQEPRNFRTLMTDPPTPTGQGRRRAIRELFIFLAPPSRISSSLGIARETGVAPDLHLE
jgi:hypothetical protein